MLLRARHFHSYERKIFGENLFGIGQEVEKGRTTSDGIGKEGSPDCTQKPTPRTERVFHR